MKTQQIDPDIATFTVIVAIVYTLFTLLIQAIQWLFQLNSNSLLKRSATNQSMVKKLQNNSNHRSTTIQNKTVSPSPVASTETSVGNTVTTGSQAVVTTPSKRRSTSKVGTTSRASKTSKSGPSTRTRSRQVKTKSNQTTQTAGLGFSI